VQWGVAHFENESPYHTFSNEITNSLVPCCQKIRLITTNQTTVRSYFGERKILLQEVKLRPNRIFYRNMYEVQMCLLGAHSTYNIRFGTIWDSRTPENLTPESGVGVGVDFFREWNQDRDSRKCLFKIYNIVSFEPFLPGGT
jgi:hypothetical protein